MKWLENKVVLITGAGEGIGKAVLERFLVEGVAGIVAFDRDKERLAALHISDPERILTVRGDVRSIVDNQKAVKQAVLKFGRLDVFIGNAGVRDARMRLEKMGEKELNQGFDDVFGVNVKGYLIGAAATREELKKSKGNTKVIPYRENRAVIFNSNLFHETDNYEFKEGYENRRVNVTLLFGHREK